MRRSRFVPAIAVLTLAAVLAGCSSASNPNTGSSSTDQAGSGGGSAGSAQRALVPYLQSPGQLSVTAPLSGKPPAGKKIYYLSDGTPVGQEISQGLREADKTLGWSTTVLTYNVANPATINSALLSAVNAGANAVVFAAVDSAAISQGLATARERGVIVVADASGNPPGTPGITAEVNSALTAGVTWGKLVGLGVSADAERTGKPAHVLEVTAPAFATVLAPTDQQVKATLAQYCSGCSYATLNISAADLAAGNTPQDVISYLQAHPDINALSFPAAAILEPGVPAALKTAGLDNVKIYGAVALQSQLQELKNGTAAGFAVDPLTVTGWMCADAIARQLVDHNASVYDHASTPQMWITKDSGFDPATPPQIPTDYQNLFKALWHLS